MNKLKMQTSNKVNENIEKIAELFPNCITESTDTDGKPIKAVDFDLLRQELSGVAVEGSDERYQFTWADKKKSILLANSPISKTLRPCREESVNFDTTKNLYIEGDNLDVLKLLQETYMGKIKMIYIDPPYNTGNDFVYGDDFSISSEEYFERSGATDDDGNRMFQNNDSNGRFHTDWLNMIYPRLKLARDLLTDDGVIFISIDDNEQANLKKICDEVFGACNFVADIIWNSTKSVTNTAIISVSHTYNLCYIKNKEWLIKNRERFRLTEDGQGFENPDNDPRGAWKADPFQVGGWRPNQQYEIVNPKTGKIYLPNSDCSWKNDFEKYQELLKDNRIIFGINGEAGPQRKRFLSEALERGKVTKTLWNDIETTTNGTQQIKKIFDKNSVFDNPKPIELIYRMLQLATDKNSLILDFFSGSATTAHAVMQLNAEDEGLRKFIMIQLMEETSEDSEARKAGYKNICEIGKERIRRAGKKIADEKPNLDVGFRVLKIDSSNMKSVFYNPKEFPKELLDTSKENIKEDRTPEDLLFQVMLDMGIDLNSTITAETLGGRKVFTVGDNNDLICCFDKEVTKEAVTEIAKRKPLHAVFRDSCFERDDIMVSFDQIFETYSPTTERRIL